MGSGCILSHFHLPVYRKEETKRGRERERKRKGKREREEAGFTVTYGHCSLEDLYFIIIRINAKGKEVLDVTS